MRSFNWRWFLKAVAVILAATPIVLYFVLMPCLNEGLYAPVIFAPVKYPSGFYDVKEINKFPIKDVEFKGKQGTLHGWFVEVPNSKFTALLNHGKGGNVSWVQPEISLLTAHGMSVLAYDYAGYGRSPGKPTVSNVVSDARSAYDYLVNERHIDPSKIILFGESLGTSVAANLSSKVACAAVILQCPLASLRQRGLELIPPVAIYPEPTWPENSFSMIPIFSKPHSPLLMVAGTADKQIPISHGDSVFKSAVEPKLYARIEGAGHTLDVKLLSAKEYHQGVDDLLRMLDGQPKGER